MMCNFCLRCGSTYGCLRGALLRYTYRLLFGKLNNQQKTKQNKQKNPRQLGFFCNHVLLVVVLVVAMVVVVVVVMVDGRVDGGRGGRDGRGDDSPGGCGDGGRGGCGYGGWSC